LYVLFEKNCKGTQVYPNISVVLLYTSRTLNDSSKTCLCSIRL